MSRKRSDEPNPPLGAASTSSCTSTFAFSTTAFCAAAPRCINCTATPQKHGKGNPIPQGARDLPLSRHRRRRKPPAEHEEENKQGGCGCRAPRPNPLSRRQRMTPRVRFSRALCGPGLVSSESDADTDLPLASGAPSINMSLHYYRCLPTFLLETENLDEDGNWVIMPPSALDRLGRFNLPTPTTGRFTHSGVFEFVAEEGFIHMPSKMMAHLGVQEHDLVLIRSTKLPTATLVKLQPHTKDFLDLPHPKELLEYNFKKFQCLTVGETIAVMEGERRYYLDVLEAQPAGAVCTIDTDCEVDFAPALDYVEPTPAPAAAPVTGKGKGNGHGEPSLFTGFAARVDGKPVEQPPPAPVPAGRQGNQPRQPAAQFTGFAARMDGKPVELPPPPAPSPAVQKRKIQFGASTAAGSGVSKGKQGGGGGGDDEKDKRPIWPGPIRPGPIRHGELLVSCPAQARH
ncbi:hypothetical protein HU200_055468 [Digitaria exilis]|uniref:Uncharacterized protein n=1 Tax=Digitaria exilis TaxID=1010633 RepID=A0A835ASD8_9POAL|nr:hypothetical protein HU200_055468 [Digitaria exilis]